MTVEKIILMLAGDNTILYIRNQNFELITSGNWYQNNVLNYMYHEVESFTWQDDEKIYIDLK